MLAYIGRRLVAMFFLLIALSVVAFVLIQLPPGDFINSYIMNLVADGEQVGKDVIASLRKQYGLDLPIYLQYFKWMGQLLQGNLGRSFDWGRPVNDLLAERLPVTIAISICTLFFTYILAIPIGIFSATRQYSVGDYIFTFVGFIGLAIPNFLLALIIMFLLYSFFGLAIGGLFSAEYEMAPWSLAKIVDLIKHLPAPIIVVGTAQTAAIIRIMRGCLLDELKKQYVITARSKGLREGALLFKYPVRVALNPIISSIAWVFPSIFSGGAITAVVLSLPTVGPLLLGALLAQDMYLAGSCVLFFGSMTFVGAFLSDIMLALSDPRIRFQAKA